jgi:hypothetical protein
MRRVAMKYNFRMSIAGPLKICFVAASELRGFGGFDTKYGGKA